MPEGPFGGPRPFAEDTTHVLLDVSLSDPKNEDDFLNIPDSAPSIDEMKVEDLIADAGVSRRRIFVQRRSEVVGGFRAIVTYRDTTLSVPEAAEVDQNIRDRLDSFYRPILEGTGQNPAPFTTEWKCSTVSDLASGKDLQERVERSSQRALEKLKSGVRGPIGLPRPFSNPDGLILMYTLEITGVAIDTDELKQRLLEMDTGDSLFASERNTVVTTGDERGEVHLLFDEGLSGLMGMSLQGINREVPKRIGRISGVEIKSSALICGRD